MARRKRAKSTDARGSAVDPFARRGGVALPLLALLLLLAGGATLFLLLRTGAPVRGSGSKGPTLAAEAGDPVSFGTVREFALTDQHGAPFGSAELAGRPWVLAAIFTTCAGPCPRVVEALQRVNREVEPLGVSIVCLSVDPAHDSPAVLRDYAERRGADAANWHFLTGEEAEIHALLRDGFFLAVERNDEAPVGMHVTHDTRLSAVDREGRVRGYYPALEPTGVDALVRRMEFLAREAP